MATRHAQHCTNLWRTRICNRSMSSPHLRSTKPHRQVQAHMAASTAHLARARRVHTTRIQRVLHSSAGYAKSDDEGDDDDDDDDYWSARPDNMFDMAQGGGYYSDDSGRASGADAPALLQHVHAAQPAAVYAAQPQQADRAQEQRTPAAALDQDGPEMHDKAPSPVRPVRTRAAQRDAATQAAPVPLAVPLAPVAPAAPAAAAALATPMCAPRLHAPHRESAHCSTTITAVDCFCTQRNRCPRD